MRDNVYHFRQKNSVQGKIPGDLGDSDLQSRVPASFWSSEIPRIRPDLGKRLGNPADDPPVEFQASDVDPSKDLRGSAFQAKDEEEAPSITQNDSKVRGPFGAQTLRYVKTRDFPCHTSLERSQDLNHDRHRGDGDSGRAQLKRDRELQKIARGESPARPSPLGGCNVGNDGAFFHEVDQAMLRYLEKSADLCEGKGPYRNHDGQRLLSILSVVNH